VARQLGTSSDSSSVTALRSSLRTLPVLSVRRTGCRDQLVAENAALESQLAAQSEKVVAYEGEIIRQVRQLSAT
jgi:hypothetical protein